MTLTKQVIAMNLSNLCLLWTFILSLTNIIGITNISWLIVFAPAGVIIIFALLIVLAAILAAIVIENK